MSIGNNNDVDIWKYLANINKNGFTELAEKYLK
jgi:hypothetical protein